MDATLRSRKACENDIISFSVMLASTAAGDAIDSNGGCHRITKPTLVSRHTATAAGRRTEKLHPFRALGFSPLAAIDAWERALAGRLREANSGDAPTRCCCCCCTFLGVRPRDLRILGAPGVSAGVRSCDPAEHKVRRELCLKNYRRRAAAHAQSYTASWSA